jgi:hypothetical protein
MVVVKERNYNFKMKSFFTLFAASSPDGSGKPLQKNALFCRRKKATAGSSFYFVQNKVFFKKLVTNSWIGFL